MPIVKFLKNLTKKLLISTLSKYGYQFFIFFSKHLNVDSVVIKNEYGYFEGSLLDAIFLSFIKENGWEKEEVSFLRNKIFANKSGTMIEVGSHVGLTMIPLAQVGIKCICFEPEKKNFQFLTRNISLNKTEQNVLTYNFALFSSQETLPMELSSTNFGDHRLRLAENISSNNLYHEENREINYVETKTLDSTLSNKTLEHPTLLKIDTQGAELDVLKGSEQTLKQIDFILIEYWPYGLKRFGKDSGEFFNFMRNYSHGILFCELSPLHKKLVNIELLIEEINLQIPSEGNHKKYIDILLTNKNLN